MPYTTFLAISATIVALVLSACGGSSRSSTSFTVPRDFRYCRQSGAAREFAPGHP
jgi:hypothetical protein